MTDAQYEVIKETFPDWAALVRVAAESIVGNDSNTDWWKGQLLGLANGMQYSGQCGDAFEFTDEAMYRAKVAAGQIK